MAFHQPTRQAVQRAFRQEDRETGVSQARPSVDPHRLDESQTSWVLFAPATDAGTATTATESDSSAARPASVQTPGRSRVSDLGSLRTAARSGSDAPSAAPSVDEAVVEEDGELDSLDSHLPSFRSLPGRHSHSQQGNYQDATVFPGHDGLGSFNLDNLASAAEAQDHLYQFEQFNPKRNRRRRESFEHPHIDWEDERVRETEKTQRIEAWRLEHSQVLLEEIQRETRRRRKSQAALRHVRATQPAAKASQPIDDSDSMTWHDEDDDVSADQDADGFLAAFMQRVIKNILGIDDRMLSILFGEGMPESEELSSTPRASQLSGQIAESSESWQTQMLERVSRELGLLVNQLSHHPGAFSTYQRMQQMPLPYAGLPVIPESGSVLDTKDHRDASSERPKSPEFAPTIPQATRALNIPGRHDTSTEEDVKMGDAFTKEEWERDLDIKLVFKYIRSRFTSRSAAPQAATNSSSSMQDAAAKAARVRQHHPLIARPRTAAERRSFKVVAGPSSPVAMRHNSSCASQSTRRSARRSSVSSRHYWDIGGSLGTGSMIAPTGPMGSWGEV
ncbi:uncharacterized protein J7T54_003081 [Emericellopsis cladophorae]|uniref:Uncharacterized protein n=1 Tax=Emericellopsis cladophorae TaxID=2686198 RepID=A0A9P9XZU5_9HYPO|nr:uncharacterized protein J7T54_003081 [Emericellopsis cladophorae]KAI6780939.1 hypothetical protein J7T54_003081 [Emericellopsis cladophorae]